ncbi:type III secretion system export apparatus subunit SctS [Paraburkholderia humisilvae]|uniref:Surface presentation of antigens protein SpaQ n=1 Tax=Paraburkholderia humisilvae TaxID=627669 RepID=A0A6J5EH37_9BURK|nr:type III secretion system export apparatus subunit SctS [Paraburkholderia humisilvae]CAB3764355.1 Surface presentation of antigens protein SpaQ [Paraburkholderia humisilvae]
MSIDTLIQFATRGMLLCLSVSLPAVMVAALVGLAVSFLQAITSMQDQTLPHAAKLIAVTVTIMIVAPVSCAAVLRFASDMMNQALPQ